MAITPSSSHVSKRLEALTVVILLSFSVCVCQPWVSNTSSFNSFGNTFNNLRSEKSLFSLSELVESSSAASASTTRMGQTEAAAEEVSNVDQARFIRRANNVAPPGKNPPNKQPANVGAIQEEPAPPPPPPPSEPSNSFVCNPGKGRSASTRSDNVFKHDIERRLYPFCVGSKTLNEYRSNLPGYALVEDILIFKKSRLQKVPIFVTNKPSDGYKNVRKVEYSILKLENPGSQRGYDPEFIELGQWIHIKITTSKPTTVLIVQANVLPYAMPYGNFDLETACKDCFQGSSLRNQFGDITNYNEELAFKDLRAAVLPCYRRTHLHTTHPNIYVYASKKATQEFHFHYKFFDMVCRETKFIQFMIANQQASGELQAFYTAVIDHESIHHTLDGQPYPMHPDLYFNCHEKEQRIIFSVPLGGNWFIGLFHDYEECLVDSEDHCEKYLEKKGYGYQSDYVCNIRTIKRTSCPFDKRVGIGGEKWNDCERFKSTVNSFEQCGHSGRVCGLCDMEQNPWHDELFRRLIRNSYRARRIHGILMIWALIGLSNISVHIARYFKETGGGIGILVGCWMWAHLGCSLFSVFFMWLAVGIVQLLPQRGYHIHPQFIPYQFPSNATKYKEKRDAVITWHFVIGTITFFVFHFVLIFGAVRPIGGRYLAILSHAAVGYLTLLLGVLSTWVSTACHETKLWTLLLFFIGIGPWLGSMMIQLKMDRENKTNRSYFPVVEAVKIVRPTPYAHSRFAILGLLTFLTYVVLVITAVKSNYFGLLYYEPCSNCPYKYDEIVLHTESDLVASAVFMIDSYECTEKDFPARRLLCISMQRLNLTTKPVVDYKDHKLMMRATKRLSHAKNPRVDHRLTGLIETIYLAESGGRESVEMTAVAKLSDYRDQLFSGTPAELERRLAESTTLYVGNLSFFTREYQIHELFSKCGDVRRIVMGLDRYKKTPCGFCFVEYYAREDTENAMRYINGTRLDDRIIRTDYDAGFEEGRQFGRGKTGGQVRDEFRKDYDPGRGGYGKMFGNMETI